MVVRLPKIRGSATAYCPFGNAKRSCLHPISCPECAREHVQKEHPDVWTRLLKLVKEQLVKERGKGVLRREEGELLNLVHSRLAFG